jgi:transcriptional regulator with XRE-family HTH domain
MEDIKSIVAANISRLRQSHGMTQLELAEQLNYSDKTISKWERAESTPDIAVLVDIAALFGVTLDYFVKAEHQEDAIDVSAPQKGKYNRKVITYISESAVWITAIFAFIIASLILKETAFQFLFLVYALPVALVVKLVFNSIWFNPRFNYFIITFLMWSLLASVHITFLYFGKDVALIYLLGIAGQVVIILWSFLAKPKSNRK